MAECKECGKTMGFADKVNAKSFDGKCVSCTSQVRENQGRTNEEIAAALEAIEQQKASDLAIKSQLDSITITITTEAVPNLKIVKRIDVISAQAAFEINNFKDMFVGFMNPVKGRSNELEKQLDELKVKSTQKLKAKAHEVGANAVVAVDLDLSTVTIGSISMMMMMASGTAVVIEE